MHKKYLLLFLLSFTTLFSSKTDLILSLIQELTDAHGGCGFEKPVREIVKRELTPLLGEMKTDNMGNLYGYREMGQINHVSFSWPTWMRWPSLSERSQAMDICFSIKLAGG